VLTNTHRGDWTGLNFDYARGSQSGVNLSPGGKFYLSWG